MFIGENTIEEMGSAAGVAASLMHNLIWLSSQVAWPGSHSSCLHSRKLSFAMYLAAATPGLSMSSKQPNTTIYLQHQNYQHIFESTGTSYDDSDSSDASITCAPNNTAPAFDARSMSAGHAPKDMKENTNMPC
jgi:hypothetical protein